MGGCLCVCVCVLCVCVYVCVCEFIYLRGCSETTHG